MLLCDMDSDFQSPTYRLKFLSILPLLYILLRSLSFMSPPLHLSSRALHTGDCTSVSFLAFEVSVETKQASPIMGLAFHFGYIPHEEYIR